MYNRQQCSKLIYRRSLAVSRHNIIVLSVDYPTKARGIVRRPIQYAKSSERSNFFSIVNCLISLRRYEPIRTVIIIQLKLLFEFIFFFRRIQYKVCQRHNMFIENHYVVGSHTKIIFISSGYSQTLTNAYIRVIRLCHTKHYTT